MSRTPRRGKPPGYEYWSRRGDITYMSPGRWSKNMTHRLERREPVTCIDEYDWPAPEELERISLHHMHDLEMGYSDEDDCFVHPWMAIGWDYELVDPVNAPPCVVSLGSKLK